MRKAVALSLVWAAEPAGWLGSLLSFCPFCHFFPSAVCSNPASLINPGPRLGVQVLWEGSIGDFSIIFWQKMVLVPLAEPRTLRDVADGRLFTRRCRRARGEHGAGMQSVPQGAPSLSGS